MTEEHRITEFSLKQERIRLLLDEHNLDGLLLQCVSSFAWATCGAASYVNTASTYGAASLLVTRKNRYLITDNIEATRLLSEEKLHYQGWEFVTSPWYEANGLNKLISGLKIGADHSFPGAINLSHELSRLRSQLTPEEGVRYRVLGRLCAEAMYSTIQQVQPGQSEHQIAAHLAMENRRRGVQAMVNLIATDERIYNYRHPIPTFKTLDRYAMLVMCGRRWGLICSLTRLVHFGSLPDELRKKINAVAKIDATIIDATRPGMTLKDVFQTCMKAYKEAGYPEEWKLHHQGGPTAYEPREWIATPQSQEKVVIGQTYAWNPSITGTKSEDTIQIGESANEIITTVPGWPTIDVDIDGVIYQRPDIMVI